MIETGATFGGMNDEYRYTLFRRWDRALPLLAFGMLNPSTADETANDPTVRRCLGYAQRWGFGGLYVWNIFALRSTDPQALYTAADPVGPRNDHEIVTISKQCASVVCAWGVHGEFKLRGLYVANLLRAAGVELHHLGLTKDGHPKHPLYLRADLEPQAWMRSAA